MHFVRSHSIWALPPILELFLILVYFHLLLFYASSLLDKLDVLGRGSIVVGTMMQQSRMTSLTYFAIAITVALKSSIFISSSPWYCIDAL
jgi:hypothetical protein